MTNCFTQIASLLLQLELLQYIRIHNIIQYGRCSNNHFDYLNTSPTDHTFNSFNRITHSSLIQLLSSSNVNIVNCMFSKSVQEGFCILFSFQVHREFSILFACSPPKACICGFQFCISHHPASCTSRWISVLHSTFQCFANYVAKIFRRFVRDRPISGLLIES